jgi:hypothetical protein
METGVIERNHVLADVEISDYVCPKIRVEHEHVVSAISGERVVWAANQDVVAGCAH